MRSGSSKGKREKPEAQKNKQKGCGAPWGMRQKEIEKSKKREYDRGKTECKRAPTKTASRAAMRGSETKAAEQCRGAIVSRGATTEKGSQGRKSKRIGEKHAMTQCINMHRRAKTSINVEVLANDKTYVPHETRTQRNALPCTAKRNRGGKMLKRGRCAARQARSKRGLGRREDIVQSGVSARKAAAQALAGEYRKGENKRRKAKGLNRLRQRKQQSNITISNSNVTT